LQILSKSLVPIKSLSSSIKFSSDILSSFS